MDEKTEKVLMDINKSIPDDLKKGLMKDVTPDEHMKEMAEHALKKLGTTKHDYTQEQTKKARETINSFVSQNEERRQEVDYKVAREIERYTETKVAQAIRDGVIPPAKKDAFIRQMQQRLKR